MKIFTSALLGAGAMAVAAFGAVQPAQARSDVGVYLGPTGLSISVDQYRNYCSDYWFRRNHPDYCARYYDSGYGYGQFYAYPRYDYRPFDGDHRRGGHDDRGRDHNDGDHRGDHHH